MSGSGALSLYGVNIPERGGISGDFSIPFIMINMIGSGLSWFVAMSWSNMFQSALDEYKVREESGGKKINQIWVNFILALNATALAIAIMYLMVRTYSGSKGQSSK